MSFFTSDAWVLLEVHSPSFLREETSEARFCWDCFSPSKNRWHRRNFKETLDRTKTAEMQRCYCCWPFDKSCQNSRYSHTSSILNLICFQTSFLMSLLIVYNLIVHFSQSIITLCLKHNFMKFQCLITCLLSSQFVIKSLLW